MFLIFLRSLQNTNRVDKNVIIYLLIYFYTHIKCDKDFESEMERLRETPMKLIHDMVVLEPRPKNVTWRRKFRRTQNYD